MTWAEDINVCTFVSFPAAVKRNEAGGEGGGGGGGEGRWEDGRDGRVCWGGWVQRERTGSPWSHHLI